MTQETETQLLIPPSRGYFIPSKIHCAGGIFCWLLLLGIFEFLFIVIAYNGVPHCYGPEDPKFKI